MPRVLTAAAVGAGLALCGAVMQALTRNPLADPYLLGLSSGASVGAVIVIVLGVGLRCRSPRSSARSSRSSPPCSTRQRSAGGASPRRAPCSPGLAVSSVVRRGHRVSSSSGARRATATARSSTGCSARSPAPTGRSVAIAGGAVLVVGIAAARERTHARRVRVRRHRRGSPRRARRPQPLGAARRRPPCSPARWSR